MDVFQSPGGLIEVGGGGKSREATAISKFKALTNTWGGGIKFVWNGFQIPSMGPGAEPWKPQTLLMFLVLS